MEKKQEAEHMLRQVGCEFPPTLDFNKATSDESALSKSPHRAMDWDKSGKLVIKLKFVFILIDTISLF